MNTTRSSGSEYPMVEQRLSCSCDLLQPHGAEAFCASRARSGSRANAKCEHRAEAEAFGARDYNPNHIEAEALDASRASSGFRTTVVHPVHVPVLRRHRRRRAGVCSPLSWLFLPPAS